MISIRTVITYQNGESEINFAGPPLLNQRFGEEENTFLQEVRKVIPKPHKAEPSVYFNSGSNKKLHMFLDGNMVVKPNRAPHCFGIIIEFT